MLKVYLSLFREVTGILRQIILVARLYGEGVAALVFRVSGMALQPVEADPVLPGDGIVAEPEVHVFLTLEALPFPVFKPALADRLYDVGRVAPALYGGVFPFDCLQSDYNGEKFHPVVCREGEAAGEFLHYEPLPVRGIYGTFQDNAVSAGTRVAARGSVGVEIDRLPVVHNAKVMKYFFGFLIIKR